MVFVLRLTAVYIWHFQYRIVQLQLRSLCLNLHRAVDRTQPADAVLDIDLPFRLQLRLVQIEIVHRANAQYAPSRERLADAVHERAAGGAEVVGHALARRNSVRLGEGLHVVAAADMGEMRVSDSEIGGEHGGRDLAAIRTVTDKGAKEPGPLCGKR